MSTTSSMNSEIRVFPSLAAYTAAIAAGSIEPGTMIAFEGGNGETIFVGTAAPTTTTKAFNVGDTYINTTNNARYWCSNISVSGTTYTYTWNIVPKDIKINGTTILDASGAANIPIGDGVVGALKADSYYQLAVDSGGAFYARNNPYSTYSGASDSSFVGKGTLENVLDNESVRFDKSTSLSDNQKTQARTNIGAGIPIQIEFLDDGE